MSERAVAAAMAGRGKSLMSAAVVASSADSEIDPQKKRSLAAKVMKMKEDITREVVQRTAAMADREERAVLRMDTFCTCIRAFTRAYFCGVVRTHSRAHSHAL